MQIPFLNRCTIHQSYSATLFPVVMYYTIHPYLPYSRLVLLLGTSYFLPFGASKSNHLETFASTLLHLIDLLLGPSCQLRSI